MILNQRLNKQSEFHKKHTLAHSSRQVGGVVAHQKQQKERWNFALRHSGAAADIFICSRLKQSAYRRHVRAFLNSHRVHRH
jgi:hypothetical protein